MQITIGKFPGSSPNYMNFLFDKNKKVAIQAWEYASAEDQLKAYQNLMSLSDRPSNIEVVQGNPEVVLRLKKEK